MIGDGIVLKPRLPLVRVPGMFLQHGFSFLDTLGVILPKDVVSDDPGEYVAGHVPSPKRESAIRQARKSTRDEINDTGASYAISDERGAMKKVLDNRQ
jgi:hypothetical protein